MTNIERLTVFRDAIDELDDTILTMFNRRMVIAAAIAEIKAEENIAVDAPSREEEVIARARAAVDEEHADAAEELMQKIMDLSKRRQHEYLADLKGERP